MEIGCEVVVDYAEQLGLECLVLRLIHGVQIGRIPLTILFEDIIHIGDEKVVAFFRTVVGEDFLDESIEGVGLITLHESYNSQFLGSGHIHPSASRLPEHLVCLICAGVDEAEVLCFRVVVAREKV